MAVLIQEYIPPTSSPPPYEPQASCQDELLDAQQAPTPYIPVPRRKAAVGRFSNYVNNSKVMQIHRSHANAPKKRLLHMGLPLTTPKIFPKYLSWTQ